MCGCTSFKMKNSSQIKLRIKTKKKDAIVYSWCYLAFFIFFVIFIEMQYIKESIILGFATLVFLMMSCTYSIEVIQLENRLILLDIKKK